ncbi:hypothetical protein AB0I10_14620 [Streptomyces sp. NPDC050636]|uniref:hypothetical protein n=1 Tax=Streptomyces sp. NPDC050636 TaxID=3154510 RepID=UPI00342209DD
MTPPRYSPGSPPPHTPLRRRIAFWAYAAFGWLTASFVWHVWMGIDYRNAMGDGATDHAPLWVFLAYDALIVVMSAVGAALALATVRPWGRRLPGRLLLLPLWFGAILLVVRGGPGLVENITTATGLTPRGLLALEEQPIDVGSADFWTGMVINTYFFVGAVLMLPLAVLARRGRRAAGGTGGRPVQEKSAA